MPVDSEVPTKEIIPETLPNYSAQNEYLAAMFDLAVAWDKLVKREIQQESFCEACKRAARAEQACEGLMKKGDKSK